MRLADYISALKLAGVDIVVEAGTPGSTAAPSASLYIDSSAGDMYINNGTAASPDWTKFSALGGSIGTDEIQGGAVTDAKLANTLDLAAKTITLPAGILSADATGRAYFATGFFDETTCDDKFASGAINGTKIKGATIAPSKLTTELAGTVVTAALLTKTISGVDFKALMDGSANPAGLGLPNNAAIFDFLIWTATAAGSAATVKVGTDANWNVASDDDALVAAHNLNTPGSYIMSRVDSGSATSGANGLLGGGSGNDLTVESSADVSGSSLIGGMTVFYVPA